MIIGDEKYLESNNNYKYTLIEENILLILEKIQFSKLQIDSVKHIFIFKHSYDTLP